jgi:gamma-glutamyltranspeptidase
MPSTSVATAAALNVVTQMGTDGGGVVFALSLTSGGDVGAFRSCGGTRCGAPRSRPVRTDGIQMPERESFTITVSGTPHGLERSVTDYDRT